MMQLPRDQWLVRFTDYGIIIAAWCNGPDGKWLHWEKFQLSQFTDIYLTMKKLHLAIDDAVERRSKALGIVSNN